MYRIRFSKALSWLLETDLAKTFPIMNGEVDGVPVDEEGNVDREQYGVTGEIKVIATGLAAGGGARAGLHSIGVINEIFRDGGLILNLGTFGWGLGLRLKHAGVKAVVINSAKYCLQVSRRFCE